jgi:hypothetical protein
MDAKPGEIVDHINGNTMDNRRCNLRFATRSQNSGNKRKVVAKSGFKGVYKKQKVKPRWGAAIRKDGQQHFLGYYDTPEEAAMAYDKMAVDLFGEYACTNADLGLLDDCPADLRGKTWPLPKGEKE